MSPYHHSVCSSHRAMILSYHHIILLPYHHIIRSYDHTIISAYHVLIITPYRHIMTAYHDSTMSSYHHISKLKRASQFWAKSQEKNRNRLVYPSAKNHRELNFGMPGVVFRDRSAGDAQKYTAPSNRHFTFFVMTFEILQNLQTAEKTRG